MGDRRKDPTIMPHIQTLINMGTPKVVMEHQRCLQKAVRELFPSLGSLLQATKTETNPTTKGVGFAMQIVIRKVTTINDRIF